MTRTKVVVAIGLVVTAIATAGVVLVIMKRPSDCDTVRAMINRHNQFNERVESATASSVPVDNSEVRDWASQLARLAEQVRDPALANQAHTLANLTEEAVPVFEKLSAEDIPSPEESPSPPQVVKDYARIAEQFNATVADLGERCPA